MNNQNNDDRGFEGGKGRSMGDIIDSILNRNGEHYSSEKLPSLRLQYLVDDYREFLKSVRQ